MNSSECMRPQPLFKSIGSYIIDNELIKIYIVATWCDTQVGILRMFQQYALFEQYQQRLSAEVGATQTQRIVNGALFLMTLGGNDFVNNYFLTPVSARSRQFTVPQYCRYLITEYRKILMVIQISIKSFFFFLFQGKTNRKLIVSFISITL